MNLDTAIQNLSADIARRAIEDAIGVVNRAFDGLKVVRRAEPVASAQSHQPKFGGDSLRARLVAEMAATPDASNRDIAARLGVTYEHAFAAFAAKARKAAGIAPRRRGNRPDASSWFGRIRSAIMANPSAATHEIAATIGAPYTRSIVSSVHQMRKALGVPSPRATGGVR